MAKRGTRLAAPFARHPLSLVRGEGGEPRRPQHDRRPHWSTRLAWVGLRKNWRGEKSPLNSCGCGREKLESAQPASSARRFSVQTFPVVSSSSSSLSSSIFRILSGSVSETFFPISFNGNVDISFRTGRFLSIRYWARIEREETTNNSSFLPCFGKTHGED